MAPAATQRRRPATAPRKRGRSRKQKTSSWLLWWPLLLALVATPFAVRAASVLVLSGPGALRLLYPWVTLIQLHGARLGLGALAPEQRDTLAQWMMWAQFPVYGLLASLVAKWRGIVAGLVVALLLHGAGVAAASLLAR
ncbi:hypothetical protein [Acidipila sp. EB88]|uniref:hypothetical protein n=1 Tax=Acidipila sp. EB88 TaxID=2305226 RepID=UPI000F5D7BA5|nr:hypothetical protein [Acidipila sp. EB88]RRA47391.1 hypothetical protein D1Y84_02860 [Acidipila sp. EB88]